MLETAPGEHLDMPLARSAHARLGSAFLLGPGWERATATWTGREDLLLRIGRREGAIAVGARVGTAGRAPTLATPLPAALRSPLLRAPGRSPRRSALRAMATEKIAQRPADATILGITAPATI